MGGGEDLHDVANPGEERKEKFSPSDVLVIMMSNLAFPTVVYISITMQYPIG